MRIMPEVEFRESRSSDKIVIFGSGPSINDISGEQWKILKTYDSIGFNFFFKGGIPTKYYLIREQCCSKKKLFPDQDKMVFLSGMRHDCQSIKIISAMRHRPDNFQWADNLDLIPGDGIVLHDIPGKVSAKHFKDDIFSVGLHHGKSTLTNCIHFAVGIGYEEVIFAGVDLVNSGCYWLPRGEVNQMTKAEGRSFDDAHNTIGNTLKLVRMLRDELVIKMSVIGVESALGGILNQWRCV